MTPRAIAPERPAKRRGALAKYGVPLILVAVGAVLAERTWLRWLDPLIDTGRELYVPWRLAEGDVLHRDVAWFNGPLSPYLHAALFALFGVSVRTLVLANLAVLAATVALAHGLLRSIGGEVAACAASLVFLACFAFGQYFPPSDFTWAFPYSHDLTHGLALAVASIWSLDRFARSSRTAWLVVHGFAVGLAFLTKPEAFAAAAAASAAGALAYCVPPPKLALAAACALVPPILAGAMLATALPLADAARGVLGGWPSALLQELRTQHFYRFTRGTLDVAESLGSIGTWLAGELGFLAAAALGSFALRGRSELAWFASAVAFVVAAAGLHALDPDWQRATLPLALALAALLVWWGRRWWSARAEPAAALRVTLTVFALALLPKIALNARIAHYGFALALPGTLVVVVALLSDVPELLRRRGGSPRFFRAAVGGALLAMAAFFVVRSGELASARDVALGTGADAFVTEARGKVVAATVAELGARAAEAETLVVLPEGATINYLARMRNPTPFVNFMPPELIMFGEANILDALLAHPPDWVVLLPRGMKEYGAERWGESYGATLSAWAQETREFELVSDIRSPQGELYMLLLRRR